MLKCQKQDLNQEIKNNPKQFLKKYGLIVERSGDSELPTVLQGLSNESKVSIRKSKLTKLVIEKGSSAQFPITLLFHYLCHQLLFTSKLGCPTTIVWQPHFLRHQAAEACSNSRVQNTQSNTYVVD